MMHYYYSFTKICKRQFRYHISREFGLKINTEKSSVMMFNMREQPEHLGNINIGAEGDIIWNRHNK